MRSTGPSPLAQAADMIDKHAGGILSYLMHPITNAAAEGINSVIQSLKHAARGLPRFESLRIRVLFFLGKLDLKSTSGFQIPSRTAWHKRRARS
ncbi:MAG: transposase, partial [Verrucomicrobiota bacterium]